MKNTFFSAFDCIKKKLIKFVVHDRKLFFVLFKLIKVLETKS